MKKFFAIFMSLILLILAMPVGAVEQTDDIIRNNENGISDINLYQEIVSHFDQNNDDLIQLNEVEKITVLFVDNKNISSLKGINHLTNLKIISAGFNNLQNLDGIEGLKLNSIYVAYNQLNDISALADMSESLKEINVTHNQLFTLPNLKSFNLTCIDAPLNRSTDFSYNKLTYAELSNKLPDHLFHYHGYGQGGVILDYDWLDAQSKLQDPEIFLGDVNLDNIIAIEDVTILQKHIAGLIEIDSVQFTNADVNIDRVVNVVDATLIQKLIADLISEF